MKKVKIEKCPSCGKKLKDDSPKCPHCNKAVGMLWYKFIIYVQMYGLAFYFVWLAIAYFRGTIYGGSDGVAASIALYETVPMLKALDIAHAIFLIGIAIASVYVRNLLAQRREGSPKKYMIVIIISILEPLIYSIISSVMTSTVISETVFSSMYAGPVYLFISLLYFKNRAKYFTE